MQHWPLTPVERKPARSFHPAHCPWADCPRHTANAGEDFSYRRVGFFERKHDRRRIQRFFCKTCHRTFSQQSFACTYYLKRPDLLPHVAAGINAGSAHRQLARSLGCAPSTVTRQSQRAGRHAMLKHAELLNDVSVIREPVAFDHFETFACSKWDRVGVATAVGDRTWFVYGLEPAPHRRSGKVSVHQRVRRRRQNVSDPPPGQVLRSTHRILDLLAARAPEKGKTTLVSDGHESYVRALTQHPAVSRFLHQVHPNPVRGPKGAPRSDLARQRDRAMFAVDSLHGLWRHSHASHKRKTIAFARRTNAIMERGYLFIVWRNLIKGRSERRPDHTTPAMRLGLTDAPWTWKRLLSQRLFPARVVTPPGLMQIYRRQWVTPALGKNAQHELKRAF